MLRLVKLTIKYRKTYNRPHKQGAQTSVKKRGSSQGAQLKLTKSKHWKLKIAKMSKYTESEIARIIHDCEVLFVPEGGSIDDLNYTSEASTSYAANSKGFMLSRYLNQEEEISEQPDAIYEDFEKIFNDSRIKRQTCNVST